MPKLTNHQLREAYVSNSIWTPVSESQNEIVTSTRRNRAIKLSRQLAASSPMYNRLLSAMLDFVIPGDTQLVVDEAPEDTKMILDHFWYKGPSSLSENARDMIFTYFVEGELILKPRINDVDGKVTLTNIDPDNIEEVAQGEGLQRVNKIRLADPTSGKDKPSEVDIISRSPTGPLRGDIFYFRLFPGGYSHGLRGLPLLTHSLDEIASFSELIYTRLTRLGEIASYYWDVTMEGATQDQVDEFLQSPRSVPPEAGETFAHNERVLWNLVSGEFESIDRELEMFSHLLAGGVGLSPEFIGRSPQRDITTESLFSSIAHLTAIREHVFTIMSMMTQYQLEQAVKHNGAIKRVPQFRIMAKEIGSRSLQRSAQAFARYADGLQKAVQQGLISDAEAANVLKLLLTQLGLVTELDMSKVSPSKYIDKSTQQEGQGYYSMKLY